MSSDVVGDRLEEQRQELVQSAILAVLKELTFEDPVESLKRHVGGEGRPDTILSSPLAQTLFREIVVLQIKFELAEIALLQSVQDVDQLAREERRVRLTKHSISPSDSNHLLDQIPQIRHQLFAEQGVRLASDQLQ